MLFNENCFHCISPLSLLQSNSLQLLTPNSVSSGKQTYDYINEVK